MADILRTGLVAFAIVMAGMILLTLTCVGLRRLVAPRAVPGAADLEASAPREDAALIAVIAAAAAEAIGRPVRVRRVRAHRAPESERWSRAGRMDIMVSHRVGPRR